MVGSPEQFLVASKEMRALPHFHGHRKRLKERFLAAKRGTTPLYELLELLLFSAHARRDVKPLAKLLLTRFGDVATLLAATDAQWREVEGVNDAVVVLLRVVRELSEEAARASVRDMPVFSDSQVVLAYCRASLGFATREMVRVLYLNRGNRLLADDLLEGTVDQAAIYPRDIVKRALELDASAVILVHNHPSGDVTPSSADIALTHAMDQALSTVQIALHDHLIVAADAWFSFRKGVRGVL